VKSFGLETHLFVKVSRPGDSEVTFSVFESSCHLPAYLAVFTLSFLMLNVKQGSCEYQLLKSFGLTRRAIVE